ncbi:hypothetical protein NLI96_g2786 [Meripilus lineatus]|uniref:DUF7704 domain-containing protein n=1 Tax=Meripilus lineatus TaxID=2056292 RepID=A0AAD5VA51_9APHY|nr:hypothetical protein NLI96_g2786 [Physisporinus lineatus]
MQTIPIIYKLFFLYIEPISAIVGSCYAGGKPAAYLNFLAKNPSIIDANAVPPTPTLISLYQLSNLYFLFALNEHIVLNSTNSIKTWRRLLFCLLLADFGHLGTMWPLALEKGVQEVYLNPMGWNAMEWGSVGFVYAGATMRLAFLFGLGMGGQGRAMEAKRE